MRRLIFITFSMLLCLSKLYSQQLSQMTQHMYMKSILNPAATGTERFLNASLWNRTQWVGFEGAPRTQILSINSSIFEKRSGIGGFLFNDAVGPINNTGVSASYSYKLPVTRDIKLALGLGFIVSYYSVNGNELDLRDQVDNLADQTQSSSTIVPEASTGLYLFHKDFYFGISAINLVNSKTPVFENTSVGGAMPRVLHFNVIGGYEYRIDKDVSLLPSIYFSKAENNPGQADFNLRLDYSRKVQIGISYRTQDAMALLLNIRFLKLFHVSYSYDLQFSELQEYSNGSHEISLGYRFYYNEIYKKMDGL